MAANIWDNSTADGFVNTAANWSLGNVPTGTDVATFDNTSDTDCVFNVSLSCTGINVTSLYNSDIDMVTFNLTTTGAMTFDGTGIFDCGTGTLTCAGNFDNKDQGTWTRGNSTVVMTGTTKTMTSGASKILNALTISGTIELSANTASRLECRGAVIVDVGKSFTLLDAFTIIAPLTVNGTLDIGTGRMLNLQGAITVGGSATVSGAGNVRISNTTITNSAGGTWSIVTNVARQNITISGTFGGTWNFEQNNTSGNRTLTFGANCTFTGPTTFDCDKVNRTYTIDLATNDVSLQFGDALTLQEIDGTATLVWSKSATGKITFNGDTDYTDNTVATQVLGDVEEAGGLTLFSEMKCDDFTLLSGQFDLNGRTLDAGGNVDWQSGATLNPMNFSTVLVGGNFTANGQSLSSFGDAWTLTVTGTAVASGVGDVENCDAGDGTKIDASAGPWTDSGGNTNWNFGVAAGGRKNPLNMPLTYPIGGPL